MKTIRHFLVPCIALALTACGVTKPDVQRQFVSRGDARNETAVLFIGNSYSFGVPRAFAKLAAGHGRRAHVEQVTHSGWSLSRHAADAETLRKVRERQWDVVVLQEQSRLPSLPLRRKWTMVPAVQKLADEIRSQGGVPVLYQTWGRRDGDPKKPRDDFHSMTSRVREGYRIAAEKAGGLHVVPVGDAWEREVSSGRGGRLFQPDGSHPSRAGNELSAQVFYRELLGR